MKTIRISTSNSEYIYDGASNNIYLYDGQSAEKEISEPFSTITPWFNKNLEKDVLAKTLVLEVTSTCNMRCKYCIYDESHPADRSHGQNNMDFCTAKQAVDNFAKRSQKGVIIFYGGEPLLNLKLIKKTISYIEENYPERFHFSVTTNTLLLDSSTVKFFKYHDVNLIISYDGPYHDLNRVTKKRKGTAKTVLHKIKELESEHSAYFQKQVTINCVMPDYSDESIKTVDKHFSQDNILNKLNIRFTCNIFSKGTNVPNMNCDSIQSEILATRAIESKFWNYYLAQYMPRIVYREAGKQRAKGCYPFANRTYCRINGEVQICEQVGDKFSKTNINNAPQLAKVLIDDYKSIAMNKCSNCWAYNFCENCYVNAMNDAGQFNNEALSKKCTEFKFIMKNMLELYINVMEKDSGILEDLFKTTISEL